MSAGSSALRRRRKPSLATRLKIAWVFIVVLLGAAFYAGYVVVTLPQLRAGTVGVSIDGIAVREHDVRAAAAIDPNGNAWLLDTAAIARRIESIPYVDTATISRALPARVTITVSERRPAACVRSGARVVTIDRARRILQNGCARPDGVWVVMPSTALGAPGTFADAPRLVDLLDDLNVVATHGVALRSIGDDAFGGIVADKTDGVRIMFGNAADLDAKAKLVRPVLQAAQPGREVRAVDVRAPKTPIIEYR